MTVEFTYVQQLVIKANKAEGKKTGAQTWKTGIMTDSSSFVSALDIQIEEGSVCLEVDYLEPLTRLIVQSKNSKIIAK